MHRPTTLFLVAACCAATLRLAAPARAQDDPSEAEVRAAAAAYIAALNRRDAAAVIDSWTDDGVMIDAAGVSHPAREFARQELTAPPKEISTAVPPAAPPKPTTSLHFVGPTVAIEQSLLAEQADDAAQSAADGNFMAVWVKNGDRWRLDLVRELPAKESLDLPAPEATPLNELEWLVGSWSAARDGAVVDMTVEWTADRAYLLQRFTATRDGREFRRGTQRLAWDAAAQQVRSWTFNADGVFSEADWRKEGNVWVATSAGVLPDGRRQKSVHFWTPEGTDACWFKSLHGSIDDHAADDLVLKFTRRRNATP